MADVDVMNANWWRERLTYGCKILYVVVSKYNLIFIHILILEKQYKEKNELLLLFLQSNTDVNCLPFDKKQQTSVNLITVLLKGQPQHSVKQSTNFSCYQSALQLQKNMNHRRSCRTLRFTPHPHGPCKRQSHLYLSFELIVCLSRGQIKRAVWHF